MTNEKQEEKFSNDRRTYSPSVMRPTRRWREMARTLASSSAANRAAGKPKLPKLSCVTWQPWQTLAASKKSNGMNLDVLTFGSRFQCIPYKSRIDPLYRRENKGNKALPYIVAHHIHALQKKSPWLLSYLSNEVLPMSLDSAAALLIF